MEAYHNDPALKNFVLDQLAQHREHDKLVKGKYWEGGRGCAVGCTLEAVRVHLDQQTIAHASHALYETRLGIPQLLACLEDGIFENLPNGKSQAWPERFTRAIRPGADLSGVWPKFVVWLLVDQQYGVIRFAKTDKSRKVIQDVADAYSRGETDKGAWGKLRYAAAYAADAAAYAAYAYAAAYAADAADAADAAYAADAYAAYAADAYAASAVIPFTVARSEHYEKMADKLIELLEAA